MIKQTGNRAYIYKAMFASRKALTINQIMDKLIAYDHYPTLAILDVEICNMVKKGFASRERIACCECGKTSSCYRLTDEGRRFVFGKYGAG